MNEEKLNKIVKEHIESSKNIESAIRDLRDGVIFGMCTASISSAKIKKLISYIAEKEDGFKSSYCKVNQKELSKNLKLISDYFDNLFTDIDKFESVCKSMEFIGKTLEGIQFITSKGATK